MPSYSYRGRDGSGQEVRGKLDAPSQGDAARAVMALGVTPLEVKEGASQGKEIDLGRFF